MASQRLCECNKCGLPVKPGNRFINGHNNRIIASENHSQWKGDNIGYTGLHKWLGNHITKPESCQNCNLVPPCDLANITGIYNRDFSNWKYLCRKCHWLLDKVIDMSDRKCSECESNKTLIQSNGRPHWYYSKITGGLLCHNCEQKEHRIMKNKVRKVKAKTRIRKGKRLS